MAVSAPLLFFDGGKGTGPTVGTNKKDQNQLPLRWLNEYHIMVLSTVPAEDSFA